MQITKFLPQHFMVINGINYFRLEDGKVAVEETTNITIETNDREDVELISLNYREKEIRFWKVNSIIYALASSSHVSLSEDVTFGDLYFSPNYPDGIYVKYTSSGKCGILYVSETQVCLVISHHEMNCVEICFEDGRFYAETEDGENKYLVIRESGEVIVALPTKCKKLEGYLLFYNDNKIFMNSLEFEIPGGIVSVEVVNYENITFVKVINNNGIYYYTKGISLLFGPIKKEKIISIDETSCYIYEVINMKIINVFYIRNDGDRYICRKLSCNKGITIYEDFFITEDKKVYIFSNEKFVLLIKDVDVDNYTFTVGRRNSSINIVAFKDGKPIYFASYIIRNCKIEDATSLEIIGAGISNETYICKNDKEIFVIDKKNGKVVLRTTGETCYTRKFNSDDSLNSYCYIVEDENKCITVFDFRGHQKI